jgi:hypothetical protein
MHTITYTMRPRGFWQWLDRLVRPRRYHATIAIPAGWDEVPDQEIMPLLGLMYEDSRSLQMLTILRRLAPIPPRVWRNLEPAVVHEMVTLLDYWLTIARFKVNGSFEHEGIIYHLPASGLTSLTGIEFANAEQLLKQAMAGTDPDTASIDHLVATICRPEKAGINQMDPEYDGDRREKYNGDIAKRRAVSFKALPMGLRVAILQWYVAEVHRLQKRYSIIWPPPDEDDEDDPDSVEIVKPRNPMAGFGFTGILLDLAKTGAFGDWEKVAFTNIHTLLTFLAKEVIDAKEAERQRLFQRNHQ